MTRGGLKPSAIARGVRGEFSQQAWQVTSHPKSPRTTGNEAGEIALKYALKLIFLKFTFEFMINTAPPASNSVYGREKWFWYNKISHENMFVTVVQWSRCCLHVQMNWVRLPATLLSISYFFVSFFSVCSSFFKHNFSFWPVFLYSYCWPCWSYTWVNIYFKLKPVFLFWKKDFKSSWLAYWPSLRPEKTISWNSWIPFFFFKC